MGTLSSKHPATIANINLKLDGKGSGVVNVVDDLTVGGNLTVNGTTTTVATTNTVISDGRIELANGTTGSPTNDTGIVIEREVLTMLLSALMKAKTNLK